MAFISIEVGPGRLSAIQGSVSGNTITVTASETVRLRRGLIADSFIKDGTEFGAALRRLLDGNRAFNANKAIVTINPANVFMREFIVPDGTVRQLDAMVNSEMINYNAATASDVIEYKVLEKLNGENGVKSARIRAFSLGRPVVDSYCGALQEAKLKPEAMDVNPNAVDKLLARMPAVNGFDQSGNSFLLLDFGYSGIMAYVVYDYMVYASRFIPIGLADLEPGIVRNGESGDLPPDFAKLLDLGKENTAMPGLGRLAEQTLLQCCNEIQKLVMFSVSRMPRTSITNVFIAGEGGTVPGVDKIFAAELNMHVAPLISLSGITFADKLSESELPYLMNAVGALIRL